MKITVHKPRKRQTIDQKFADNVSLMNFPEVLSDLYNNAETMLRLTHSNIDGFTELYGKPEGCFRHEANNYYWRLECNDLLFTVFSGKGRGTSYEVQKPVGTELRELQTDTEFCETCKQFLNRIHEQLRDVGNQELDEFFARRKGRSR